MMIWEWQWWRWWWWWIFTEECSWPMQALAASAISSQIWSLWRPSSNNSFSHDLIYYLNSMFGLIWSPWLPSSKTPPSSWPISMSTYALDNICLSYKTEGANMVFFIISFLIFSNNQKMPSSWSKLIPFMLKPRLEASWPRPPPESDQQKDPLHTILEAID